MRKSDPSFTSNSISTFKKCHLIKELITMELLYLGKQIRKTRFLFSYLFMIEQLANL